MSLKNQFHTFSLASHIYPLYLRYRFFGRPVPLSVHFAVTNQCNLRCDYCFLRPEKRQGREMPLSRLLGYVDEFLAMGTRYFELQGGEPTLHPELGALISRIVDRGAACVIATNGLGVEKHLEALKKCYKVCVSLDGLENTTDLHRGKGAYAKAVKALETMARAGISVRIHGVVTLSTTPPDIDHLISLAQRLGTNVNFVYALDTGSNKTGCDARQGFPEHIRNIAGYILERKRKGAPVTSKAGSLRQVMEWPYDPQEILIEKKMTPEQAASLKRLSIPRCLWGDLACFFNPEGRLYLCPRAYDREGFYVDIGGRPLKEAFKELVRIKPCHMCGQMGDLSRSFGLEMDNIRTWLKF